MASGNGAGVKNHNLRLPMVIRSITPAPWEIPPRTILVAGHMPATYWTCFFASTAPSEVDFEKFQLAE